ncbi:hypothetical protein [Persephonella sp.]
MKWIILLMLLLYVGTMVFFVYMRLKPALKRKKPPKRADNGVQQRDEQQDQGDE